MGFIDRRRDGLTRRLTTTRRFAEYFGCPEVEYQKVREWFRAEAGKAGELWNRAPIHTHLMSADMVQ